MGAAMKHDRFTTTLCIAVLCAALAGSPTSSAQNIATPQGKCVDARGCGNSPSSGGSATPSGPTQQEVRQQQMLQRMKAKEWSTDEALDYVKRGDWDNAIRSFEEALDKDPDDEDLQQLLKNAKAEKAAARPRAGSPEFAACQAEQARLNERLKACGDNQQCRAQHQADVFSFNRRCT